MTLPLYNNMCHLFVNPNLHSVFTIKCKNKTSKWPEFLAGFSYSLKLKRMWENFQLLAKICENVCRRGRQINFWYISMPVHTFSHVRLATWISSAMQYFPVVQFFPDGQFWPIIFYLEQLPWCMYKSLYFGVTLL